MLPPFVERGGEQVVRGPFLQADTDYRGFVLRADPDRLAAVCARAFTTPTGGAVTVRPAGDHVLLSVARIGAISTLEPGAPSSGGPTETDVALWIPVTVEAGAERLTAWYIAYIFVDEPVAVTTGREHYGFPKCAARFDLPRTIAGPHAVETLTIGRDGAVRRATVLEVRPSGVAPSRVATLAALGGLLGVSVATPAAVTSLFSRDLPVLFLRQLRDVAAPARARFQEVVLAPVRPRTIRSVGFADTGFTLHLHDCASHPIAADLGLAPVSPVAAAFALDFDFEMGLGRTLWCRAGDAGNGAGNEAGGGRRRRIAVLGGGISALTAVYEITDQPGWQEHTEITVYQMGFRLGGKGASGRNADAGQRIEEHGLHIWFGFYENAFRLMRRCFAAAGRPPGTPLATWRDAFHPQSHFVVQEQVEGEWLPWEVDYPTNDALPGDPSPELGPVELGRHLVRWADALVEGAIRETGGSRTGQLAITAVGAALRAVMLLTRRAVEDPSARDAGWLGRVTAARRRLRERFERAVERDTRLRRTWIGIDWALTNLHGMARDGVFERGFDAINDWDYCAWLRHHGASEMTVRSAPVRAGYDLIFAYERGDVTRPNFAAGIGLYGLLRMFFTYKGAMAWKMQAGMGDVVFTPLYEVLTRRGVKFAFFHKVEELRLSADGERIGEIAIARQATVRGGEYRPLVEVKGIRCWPDRPDLTQLVEGEALRGVDLESSWNGLAPVERTVLREGVDFEAVILGIPVAALRSICAPLIAARPEWKAMVENVATVCTHAFQLWTTPDLAGLGWRGRTRTGEAPVMGAYAEPTDTWADMTHLVPAEDHVGQLPGHIAYFCGPMRDPEEYPPLSDTGFPERERERCREMARGFLDTEVHRLWPAAVDGEGRFRRELLVDPQGRDPEERFARQLFKGNVEPSDRYTVSHAGTVKYRLRADGSGFANLFLAGDWIDNGFNAGCIEASVMAGMQCARAVTGADIRIHGENHRLRPAAHRSSGDLADRVPRGR